MGTGNILLILKHRRNLWLSITEFDIGCGLALYGLHIQRNITFKYQFLESFYHDSMLRFIRWSFCKHLHNCIILDIQLINVNLTLKYHVLSLASCLRTVKKRVAFDLFFIFIKIFCWTSSSNTMRIWVTIKHLSNRCHKDKSFHQEKHKM